MNNKMVPMAVLDLVWMVISYAALLVFIAIMGVIVVKFGITSFKLAMNTVGATKGIENIKRVNPSNYRATKETDEFEIIVSYATSFTQTIIERNHYAKYAYDLFRVELIISYIKSLDHFVESKLEEIDYAGYAQKLFKTEKLAAYVDSFKSFVESKLEKIDYAEYTLELFKTEKFMAHVNSFKSFVESKREKNFARYAYIQLFKK